MLTVTKKFEICYGHRLPDYDGPCANFHGHNSTIEVELGPEYRSSDSEHARNLPHYPTMLLDFSTIKRYIEPIIKELDHRNLNEIFTYPTAEQIILYLVDEIRTKTPFGDRLVRIRLYETSTSYAEWRSNDH